MIENPELEVEAISEDADEQTSIDLQDAPQPDDALAASTAETSDETDVDVSAPEPEENIQDTPVTNLDNDAKDEAPHEAQAVDNEEKPVVSAA